MPSAFILMPGSTFARLEPELFDRLSEVAFASGLPLLAAKPKRVQAKSDGLPLDQYKQRQVPRQFEPT
ncbi:hypothetical protein [Jeongeupia chitinilytica]|uniref:Uncharacterized protein n=1 Tax=Jeongeupia chitinilytica TaxID=1041641 RepID=A0ABQ3GW12_9NEIS|nr:hypothetical protein [Jeongeupia chitinilytica]GHD57841.1 hypothetical protein GCM10007350_06750 [Jeongeupia chitinilytica]